MLLILTNSYDETAAQFASFSPTVPCFRFNTDLWRSYRCALGLSGWSIQDPSGRAISSGSCGGVWYRKPGSHLLPDPIGTEAEECWAMAQVQAVVDHLVSWARCNHCLLLVDPLDERRVDKLTQLQAARRHFRVPGTLITWGEPISMPEDQIVAKSLAAAGFDGGRFLFTKRVSKASLDTRWPWYLQSEHDGFDVTAVFVAGEVFAAQLDRRTFSGQDWRRHIYSSELDWQPCALSASESEGVHGVMRELSLCFGRLDFIRERNGELVFLEVNTNGEWGWLDDGRRGIFSAVARAAERLLAQPRHSALMVHETPHWKAAAKKP